MLYVVSCCVFGQSILESHSLVTPCSHILESHSWVTSLSHIVIVALFHYSVFHLIKLGQQYWLECSKWTSTSKKSNLWWPWIRWRGNFMDWCFFLYWWPFGGFECRQTFLLTCLWNAPQFIPGISSLIKMNIRYIMH